MPFSTDETIQTPKLSWQDRLISGVKSFFSQAQEKAIHPSGYTGGARLRWYHWASGVLILGLLAVFVFLAGLRHNFPGDTIVRYFEQELGNRFQIYAQVDPIELGGWNASIGRAVFSKNIKEGDVPPVALLELTEIKMPWIPALLNQNFNFSADAYDGKLQGQFNGPLVSLAAQNLQLDRIPILSLASFLSLRGIMSFQETIPDFHLSDEQALLPQGTLELDLKKFEILIKDLDVLLDEEYQELAKGVTIPPIQLDTLHLEATHGNAIEIKKATFSGDFSGSIEGKLAFNPKKMEASQMRILVMAKPSGEWLKALGPLSVAFQPYLCGDTLHIEFVGPLLQPKPRKGRC